MDINVIGTAYGLALSSGISAYLPLLSFAVAVRWLHWFPINPNFAFITQNGFIIALIILTILDIIADKVPVLDNIWDSIHTILRPVAGAIVAGATSAHATPTIIPVILILGGLLAAMGHATKAVIRLTTSISTMGCLNIGISIGEDVAVVIAILLAIFAPVVMLVFSIIFTVLFIIFAPMLFSALRYSLLISFSSIFWFIQTYFIRGANTSPSDFRLKLSDREQIWLRQVLPSDAALLGGIRLLWRRRLDGWGLWGRRRAALQIWFIVADGVIVLIPRKKPHLSQIIAFSQVQALTLDQGLLMGTLKLLGRDGQQYNFTVLRESLDTAIDVVETLHLRHHLPSGTTTGTTRVRPIGPQRI